MLCLITLLHPIEQTCCIPDPALFYEQHYHILSIPMQTSYNRIVRSVPEPAHQCFFAQARCCQYHQACNYHSMGALQNLAPVRCYEAYCYLAAAAVFSQPAH